MTEAKTQNRDFVTSLAKGLAVIQAFGEETPRMTLSEVASHTGLTRAGARRLLLTLQDLGFVQSSGRYFELAPRVLSLGYSFLSAHGFTNVIQNMLEEVTRELNESSSVGMLDGTDVVYVARSPADHRLMSIGLSVGSRLPALATSMGRAIVAFLPEAEQESLLASARLQAYTDRTVTDRDALRAVLRRVHKQGYCVVDQELEHSLRSLAVPIHATTGKVVAAVNVSTNAGRVRKRELLTRFLPVLRRCAAKMKPYI